MVQLEIKYYIEAYRSGRFLNRVNEVPIKKDDIKPYKDVLRNTFPYKKCQLVASPILSNKLFKKE